MMIATRPDTGDSHEPLPAGIEPIAVVVAHLEPGDVHDDVLDEGPCTSGSDFLSLCFRRSLLRYEDGTFETPEWSVCFEPGIEASGEWPRLDAEAIPELIGRLLDQYVTWAQNCERDDIAVRIDDPHTVPDDTGNTVSVNNPEDPGRVAISVDPAADDGRGISAYITPGQALDLARWLMRAAVAAKLEEEN